MCQFMHENMQICENNIPFIYQSILGISNYIVILLGKKNNVFETNNIFPSSHSLMGQASENQSLEAAGGYPPWLAEFHGLGWFW